MAKKVLSPPPDEEEPDNAQSQTLDDSGFMDMVKDVDHDIEEADTVQKIVDHVPELKRMNEDIEKATTAVINARLGLEAAIQKYQIAEKNLDNKVTEISKMVDTINTHIDGLLKDAPTKLTVTVKATEEDLKAIQDEFDLKVKSVKAYMLKEFRNINDMMIEERRRTREKFNGYDGVWFGHIGQWFFLAFYYIGIFIVVGFIAIAVANAAGWFK